MLHADWPVAARLLLRKTYDYGSAVWMLRMAGMRFGLAAATVSIALAVLEAVQLRLPGRTPEITDPAAGAAGGVRDRLAGAGDAERGHGGSGPRRKARRFG